MRKSKWKLILFATRSSASIDRKMMHMPIFEAQKSSIIVKITINALWFLVYWLQMTFTALKSLRHLGWNLAQFNRPAKIAVSTMDTDRNSFCLSLQRTIKSIYLFGFQTWLHNQMFNGFSRANSIQNETKRKVNKMKCKQMPNGISKGKWFRQHASMHMRISCINWRLIRKNCKRALKDKRAIPSNTRCLSFYEWVSFDFY